MIVKGCGVDAIEIPRIARAIQRESFCYRIYTEYERQYLDDCPPRSWATRFAAKEALMKAVGRGWQQGVPFACVEIRQNEWGQPYIELFGEAFKTAQAQGVTRFTLSLTHTRELAMAYVIALGEV